MLRHLPNTITALRILSVPVLVWAAFTRRHDVFTPLLIAGLLSDVLDGILARQLRLVSPLGALLDSIADTLLFYTAVFGAFVFYPDVLRAHAVACALVPLSWLVENVAALVRYGRLSSFHTLLRRVSAYAMGFFIGFLFLGWMHPWLLYAAVTLFVLATVEELALQRLFPTWTSDVRGLWWVLRKRRPAA